jgi:hypothetical protein
LEEIRITKRNQKDYSKSAIIFGNIAVIAWISLGAIACWFIHPLIGWSFLVLVSFSVYYILKKHCCKTCYYCKGCTIGFGKLPELFFSKTGTENVDATGLRMFPYIYGVMTFVPTILLIVSLLNQFTLFKIIVLILLIGFSVFSGAVRKKLLLRGFKT